VLNAVSLALFDYTDKDMNGPLNKKLDLCNKIFTIIFIVEAVLKIMAMGFILHPYAYMRDYWNAIDIIIVITG
jgi:voltage-dependent calcium channel L type alpha-1D